MERITRATRERYLRPRDVSALLTVLAIAIAVIVVVSLVLF